MNDSPFELEKKSEYEAAARAYATQGFRNFLESHFRMNSITRTGIGYVLQAISCDSRAGNERRAEYLFEMVKPILMENKRTTDDIVLKGLVNEWLGDGQLFLYRDEAIASYHTALQHYDDLTWRELTWREEPEFMQAYWAVERFSRFQDEPLPENPDSISFQERVKEKIRTAEQLLAVEKS